MNNIAKTIERSFEFTAYDANNRNGQAFGKSLQKIMSQRNLSQKIARTMSNELMDFRRMGYALDIRDVINNREDIIRIYRAFEKTHPIWRQLHLSGADIEIKARRGIDPDKTYTLRNALNFLANDLSRALRHVAANERSGKYERAKTIMRPFPTAIENIVAIAMDGLRTTAPPNNDHDA